MFVKHKAIVNPVSSDMKKKKFLFRICNAFFHVATPTLTPPGFYTTRIVMAPHVHYWLSPPGGKSGRPCGQQRFPPHADGPFSGCLGEPLDKERGNALNLLKREPY